MRCGWLRHGWPKRRMAPRTQYDLSGPQCHDADCPGGPGGDAAVSDRGMGQPVQQLPVWVQMQGVIEARSE